MRAHVSLDVNGSLSDFDGLEAVLNEKGVKSERYKPIQFTSTPPDTTVLLISGAVKVIIACFWIYRNQSKKMVTLVKGNDYFRVENCTDEQIKKALSNEPEIYIHDPKEGPQSTRPPVKRSKRVTPPKPRLKSPKKKIKRPSK